MKDTIPPTPERIAKGDLVAYKRTGRADSARFSYDKMRDRGKIDGSQWSLCNHLRVAFDAFNSEHGVKICGYGSVQSGKSTEQYEVDRITLVDRYRHFLRACPADERRALSMIVCGNMSLKDGARCMGKRYENFCYYFESGLEWLDKHFT